MANLRHTLTTKKLNDISKLVYEAKDKAIQEVLKEGKEKLKNKVQSNWYNTYSPLSYNRTNEILESVSSDMVDSDTVKIYYDYGKVGAASGNGWNIHESFDGSPFDGIKMVRSVEFGMGIGVATNPRNGEDGVEGLDEVRKWAKKEAKKIVKKYIKL